MGVIHPARQYSCVLFLFNVTLITLLLFAFYVLGYSDVPSSGSKGYYCDYVDSTADYTPVATDAVNDVSLSDQGYLVFGPQCESTTDDVPEVQQVSEESLRQSLKERLEFFFSRWVA